MGNIFVKKKKKGDKKEESKLGSGGLVFHMYCGGTWDRGASGSKKTKKIIPPMLLPLLFSSSFVCVCVCVCVCRCDNASVENGSQAAINDSH